MTCEEFKRAVTDYLEGVVPAERRHCFEHHLASCDACGRHLQELQRTIVALGQLDPIAPPAALRAQLVRAFERRWAAQQGDSRAAARPRTWLQRLEALRRSYSTWRLLGLALLVSLALSLAYGPRVEIHRPGLPRICLLVELVAGLLPASALTLLCWRARQRISIGSFALVAAAGALAGQLLLFAACPMLDSRGHALVIHSTGVVAAILLGVLLGCLPVPGRF